VVAGDVGFSVSVPLKVDATGIGVGGESDEEGAGGKEETDGPRS
jgi:hypothetical protein